MRIAINAVIDRRLEHLILARLRRKVPALHFVPDRWLIAATKPTVPRLRHSLLHRVALAASGAAIALSLTMMLVT